MTTITRERVAEIIHAAGLEPCDYEEMFGSIKTGEIVAMARIALDSLDAKPVAWTDEEELRDANVAGIGYLFGIDKEANKFADPRRQIMLYRHAQPAPVVPDERTAFNEWNNSEDCPLAGRDAKSAAWLAWSYRSKLGVTPMPEVFDDFESWFKDVLLPGMSLIKLKEAECKLIHGVTLMAWNARAARLSGSRSKLKLSGIKRRRPLLTVTSGYGMKVNPALAAMRRWLVKATS